MKNRMPTRKVKIGPVAVGGNSPISVQSMTNTKTTNVEATLAQIAELACAGCEIVRLAVPDQASVQALPQIIAASPVPLVADIHFDYNLALTSIKAGIAALRINPGNIGSREKVEQVVKACQTRSIPIRIGVNAGSLEKKFAAEYGHTAQAMAASAGSHIQILEELDFRDIIVSLKASSIAMTLEANRLFAEKYDYPLHIGITEAGLGRQGEIKSAAGLGALLSQGLGDTLRVSLTADPIKEVEVGLQILKALELRRVGVEIISCPTCGRTQINLVKLAQEVEKALADIKKPLTVAVMGCAVNGPGEAGQADIGIAGGKGSGLIFKDGEIIKKVPEDQLLSALLAEINKMESE
ncbi:MAG: flavodoxin-dependent (E)-4-hydroxy-3-methylbut-2-enyl-diphosphate synthase [Bacillota bacterium]